MNRRSFVKNTIAALMGLSIIPYFPKIGGKKMPPSVGDILCNRLTGEMGVVTGTRISHAFPPFSQIDIQSMETENMVIIGLNKFHSEWNWIIGNSRLEELPLVVS